MGSSEENGKASCNTDLSQKVPNSWIWTLEAKNRWVWRAWACLARRVSGRSQLVPAMDTHGHTQSSSAGERERESTSAHPACKETSRGSPGPVEEKWILSRGISAWRQIAGNWFRLNYSTVSKIHFTFMWESHKYRKLFVQISFMGSGESRPHQNDSSSVQLR